MIGEGHAIYGAERNEIKIKRRVLSHPPLEFGHFYLVTDEPWQGLGTSRAGPSHCVTRPFSRPSFALATGVPTRAELPACCAPSGRRVAGRWLCDVDPHAGQSRPRSARLECGLQTPCPCRLERTESV